MRLQVIRALMAEIGADSAILADANFKKLASSKTAPSEFLRLVGCHVGGYTQKKRLADGLKVLIAKIEEAEKKVSVEKALGKAKRAEPEEHALVAAHCSHDCKEKLQSLNTVLQAMIDQGHVTAEEKQQVVNQMIAKRAAARAADKATVVEKIERMIVSVSNAAPFTLPLENLGAINSMLKNIEEAELLEKRPWKSLTGVERDKVDRKAKIYDEIRAVEKSSLMWFETEAEFKPRLAHSLTAHAKLLAEQRRLEEEQAWERARLEEEHAREKKRLDAIEKAEREGRELILKLEAKRLEDEGKEKKPVVQPKKKEKPARMRLNPLALFVDPRTLQQAETEEEWADADADTSSVFPSPSLSPSPSPSLSPLVVASAAPSQQDADAAALPPAAAASPLLAPAKMPVQEIKSKADAKAKAKTEPKPVIESKWGDVAPPVLQEGDETSVAGPSLAEAAKAVPVPVKKTPPPQPKKKEKGKFSKMGADLLGFDCNNPNLVKN